jgi:hypothetical protein
LMALAVATMATTTTSVNVHAQTEQCTYQREPPLPAVMPSTERPHIIFAQGIGYPPFADVQTADEGGQLTGFGHDVAMGLMEVCDMDIEVTETQWVNCWGNDVIGKGLDRGYYHSCINYYNAQGVRERYMEFSKPMLNDNTPDALLTRLDENGNPVVNGLSDLAGHIVVDMPGFAPSQDQLPVVENYCTKTDDGFKDYIFIPPIYGDGPGEDDALRTLLDGYADVLYIAAGQAESYMCNATDAASATSNGFGSTRNCTLWDGLGTTYAYIHTGMKSQEEGGTTMSMSKIGSGLPALLNPCLEKFIATESYYNLCAKYGLLDTCYENDFFPADVLANKAAPPASFYPTDELPKDLTVDCSKGYCPCPAE